MVWLRKLHEPGIHRSFFLALCLWCNKDGKGPCGLLPFVISKPSQIIKEEFKGRTPTHPRFPLFWPSPNKLHLLTGNRMPPSNGRAKSTTAARDFAETPPYSPAKRPMRMYGSKGKNKFHSRQPKTALAYQDLEILPLPNAHSGADSEGSDDDEIVFISGSMCDMCDMCEEKLKLVI
ncbi:hypothetical protein BT96DRAFT_948747 [Gymnopus androsaceus JB14]|uniref:Uncharacterized protein n=1 Tax=Gymnopus androsaceus JB14 TaxID=1447944 RepID=A0A6A4GN11_9AGAR|nr:hypothetical protein BT96DRAFT_948747 [Gymnopus androsaceus JB14]